MKSLLDLEEGGSAPESSGGGAKQSRSKDGAGWRERLDKAMSSGAGRAALVVILLAGIGFGGWSVMGFVEEGRPDLPKKRLMNPETGELRWYYAAPGKPLPEGFLPVEYCFQNQCGPAGGTPVVLNSYRGTDGLTTCPECGARVTVHNAIPPEYKDVTPADQQ